MSASTPSNPSRTPARRRLHWLIALIATVTVAVTLAACGGSSSSNSGDTSSTSSSATNSANATKPGGPGPSRFASLRSCLQKEGINLPSVPSGGVGQQGSGEPPSGGAGGVKLPEGVSRSKFQEAIKKCGGGGFPNGSRSGFNSATAKAALTKYSTCMRENGINLPEPNTSGKGPVFDTKGIDTSSESFKNAQKKCQTDLKGAFGAGRPPGGGQPPAGAEGGGPPAGEGAPPAGGYGPPPGSGAESG